MISDTDNRVTDADTETVQVLLLVANQDHRQAIEEWIGAQSGYEAVERVAPGAFDVCLFDREGFERDVTALSAAKVEAAPAALPFVLVISDRIDNQHPVTDWTAVEREFEGLVDDVITAPVRDIDLAGTLHSAVHPSERSDKGEHTESTSATFRQIVDAMEQAVYVTDDDGVIEFVNPAFTEITGYEPGEARGETAAILNSGYQDDAYYHRLWETISSGSVWSERVVNERKDGKRYHAQQTIVPVTDTSDDVSGYVAIQTDITDRTNQTRHLKVVDRVLRHNMSNELNVIRGRAELIAEAAPDHIAEHAETIIETTDALVETAEKERTIVRHVIGEEVPTELNVTNVARKTARKVREQHSDARINVFLDPGTNATASPKLSEAVEELLVNAVVHNDADQPTVNLRVTQQPDAVEMTISDNGPGIPENERDVLRHDSPPDQLFHGRGLGLWLARWIIAFSRGTISIEENRSCGATVKIRLTNKGQRPKLLTPAELD